jgi:hypothetical protein
MCILTDGYTAQKLLQAALSTDFMRLVFNDPDDWMKDLSQGRLFLLASAHALHRLRNMRLWSPESITDALRHDIQQLVDILTNALHYAMLSCVDDEGVWSWSRMSKILALFPWHAALERFVSDCCPSKMGSIFRFLVNECVSGDEEEHMHEWHLDSLAALFPCDPAEDFTLRCIIKDLTQRKKPTLFPGAESTTPVAASFVTGIHGASLASLADLTQPEDSLPNKNAEFAGASGAAQSPLLFDDQAAIKPPLAQDPALAATEASMASGDCSDDDGDVSSLSSASYPRTNISRGPTLRSGPGHAHTELLARSIENSAQHVANEAMFQALPQPKLQQSSAPDVSSYKLSDVASNFLLSTPHGSTLPRSEGADGGNAGESSSSGHRPGSESTSTKPLQAGRRRSDIASD